LSIRRTARTIRSMSHCGCAWTDSASSSPLWKAMRQFAAALALVGAATLAPASLAQQQEFTLTKEDTWKQTEAVDPATPEGQLLEARKMLARGEASRASQLASQ